MNTLLLSPTASIIDEVCARLKGDDCDYSGEMVIFPGKRPSHFLRKRLADQIKKSFIPPSIFSMDEFVDYIFEEKLKEESKKIEPIDAFAILYELNQNSSSPVGGKNFLTPDSFFSIAMKLFNDLEELCIEEIDAKEVKQIDFLTSENIPAESLNRLASLSGFYSDFYREVEQKGFSTRALRYKKVSQFLQKESIGNFRNIIFAGFFALTKTENHIVKNLIKNKNTLLIFHDGPGIQKEIETLGSCIEIIKCRDCSQNSLLTRIDEKKPKIYFYKTPDSHGQVFALNKILTDLTDRGVNLDIKNLIMLPSSDSLFPLIRHSLSILDSDTYNVSLGFPLQRTPVYGFFSTLLDLISSMEDNLIYLPDYLKYILHPYTKNIYFKRNPEITRIIVHSLNEKLKENRSRLFVTLSEIENAEYFDGLPEISKEEALNHLKFIHQNTFIKLLSLESIKHFAEMSMEILTFICEESTAPLHPFFFPFTENFLQSLENISKSLAKDIKFTTAAGYFIFMKRYLNTCYIPFEGVPLSGLQVLGALETRNLKPERLFILDVNEEVIPDTKKENSLIPLKAREILNLPTYLDREKIAAYYFDVLIKGALDVHLFYVEQANMEKSRFAERLIWEREKEEAHSSGFESSDIVVPVQYRIKLANNQPEEILKSDDIITFLKIFKYSSTSLDEYLKCQLRFYYKYILNIRETEKVTGALQVMDIGTTVHRLLYLFFKNKTGRVLNSCDIHIEEMDDIIETHFNATYGSEQKGSIYLLKLQIKKQLRNFILNYQIPVLNDEQVEIIELEKEITVTEKGFMLHGRVDKIEKRGSKFYLIDYKTSANSKNYKIDLDKIDKDNRASWDESIKSLQLPFYMLLFSSFSAKAINRLNASLLLIGRSSINKDIEQQLFDDSKDNEKHFEILKDIIFRLIAEICDKKNPFTPTPDRKERCKGCAYIYNCGSQF